MGPKETNICWLRIRWQEKVVFCTVSMSQASSKLTVRLWQDERLSRSWVMLNTHTSTQPEHTAGCITDIPELRLWMEGHTQIWLNVGWLYRCDVNTGGHWLIGDQEWRNKSAEIWDESESTSRPVPVSWGQHGPAKWTEIRSIQWKSWRPVPLCTCAYNSETVVLLRLSWTTVLCLCCRLSWICWLSFNNMCIRCTTSVEIYQKTHPDKTRQLHHHLQAWHAFSVPQCFRVHAGFFSLSFLGQNVVL